MSMEVSTPAGRITSIGGRPVARARRPIAVAERRTPPPRPRGLGWKVHGLLLPFCGHTVEHDQGRDAYSADTVFDGGPNLELRCEHSSIIGAGRVTESKAGLVFDGTVWPTAARLAPDRRWLSARLAVLESHEVDGITVVDRARLDHASLVKVPASRLCYATLRVG